MSKTGWIVGAVVLAAVAGTGIYLANGKKAGPKYRLDRLERGDVTATVTATGALSAVTTVKVGSQVSGIIAKLFVDFNTPVRKGQLLAELDPTPFLQSVAQRKADLEKARVELRSTEITLKRQKNLFSQQLVAQSDLDGAQTNRDSAAAAVAQSVASLRQAETNLSYSHIASPIDGVVVDRQYDVGQTVAASFQAPVLFTIAQDLTKMQVLTNIDEADVGRIQVGQEATFTVDAFADRRFRGSVSQVRLSPQIVQNVVTYPVMLDVPNPELKLKPGMTANVLVPVDARKDVLKVPNAALRFRPDPADLLGGGKDAKSGGRKVGAAGAAARGERPAAGNGGTGRPAGRESPAAPGRPGVGPGPGAPRMGTVYVVADGGKLKAISVRTSITDGNVTAVESSDLKPGDEVIVGLATARAGVPGGGSSGSGGPPRGMRM